MYKISVSTKSLSDEPERFSVHCTFLYVGSYYNTF